MVALQQFLAKMLGHKGRLSAEFVICREGRLKNILDNAPTSFQRLDDFRRIEQRAAETERLGAKPLWEGYRDVPNYPRTTIDSVRSSNQVRSTALMGEFFSWLTMKLVPETIVEFGTAFGISGMYWLAGLNHNRHGRLLAFEPNSVWADIAYGNLSSISDRFDLTVGTFEQNIYTKLGQNEKVDIAFVDAIHTSEFVLSQFDILLKMAMPNGMILFDDINFSEDMKSCWQSLARHHQVRTSAIVNERLGIVELALPA
jgi:predicted O-methyltransferase YrrM